MSGLRQLEHDVRTPLNVVMAYAELLGDEADPERRAVMSRAVLAACREILEQLDAARQAP